MTASSRLTFWSKMPTHKTGDTRQGTQDRGQSPVLWCVVRVSYISVAVTIVNKLTTVSSAYPLTWTLSGIVFIIYLLKADWIHNFDRKKA
ncbi:MAG: hypothetical protein IJB24_05350 [Clostridia bacterium]|nr:hypothetical protein [Clostridia bacterium]